MMRKCLEPKKESSLQKQRSQSIGKKTEAICVHEFNKPSASVILRLRAFEKVHNRIFKQFLTRTRDCRQKTAMPDYFTDEEAMKAYNSKLARHF